MFFEHIIIALITNVFRATSYESWSFHLFHLDTTRIFYCYFRFRINGQIIVLNKIILTNFSNDNHGTIPATTQTTTFIIFFYTFYIVLVVAVFIKFKKKSITT